MLASSADAQTVDDKAEDDVAHKQEQEADIADREAAEAAEAAVLDSSDTTAPKAAVVGGTTDLASSISDFASAAVAAEDAAEVSLAARWV